MINDKNEFQTNDLETSIITDFYLPTWLGEQIRFYRKKKKMKLETLAMYIHKSKATLSKYESGTIVVDIITLFKIAEVLEVNIKQFLPYKEIKKKTFTNMIFDIDKPIYMYHFTNNTIHTSIMKMNLDENTQEINVLLYYIIKDSEDLNLCSCVYNGIFRNSYSIATFLLNNYYNSLETAMITLSIALKKQSYYIGFLTGIHFDHLKPSVFKVLLTQTPFEGSNDELKKYLLFSKKDEQILKNKNYLTLSES